MKKLLYVFGILSDADIDWLLAVGQLQEFQSTEYLIRTGEFPDSLILLIDGRCDIVVDARSRIVINHCGGGELLGELSFIDDLPASASVIATERSRALCIDREILNQRLATERDFAARFYHSIAYLMADRVRANMQRESQAAGGIKNVAGTPDQGEMSLSQMDNSSMAARRYEHLLSRLQVY